MNQETETIRCECGADFEVNTYESISRRLEADAVRARTREIVGLLRERASTRGATKRTLLAAANWLERHFEAFPAVEREYLDKEADS